ncbi:MAG: glycosyltransferase [Thermoleophilia bacterium]
MKVLVACGWPRGVGAAVHAGRLSAALRARGIVVRGVAVGDQGVADPELQVLEPESRESVTERLSRAVREPVEIGHAEDPSAAVALLALRDEGRVTRVVSTVHHLEGHAEREAEERERRAVQESDVVVCASRWWADRIRSEFGVEAMVVPHGVEAARFAGYGADRAAAGQVMGWGQRPVVLTLGGVQQRKGSRTLLEAFARARSRLGRGSLLVVAGPTEASEFRTAWLEDAERLGLAVGDADAPREACDVIELGPVDADRMPLLYRASDVVATPSTREGFGLGALEAAAAGVPNVLSDLPAFREHHVDEQSCLMVPVGDSGPLAIALVRAIREAPLRERLVEEGRRVAMSLSWDVSAGSHESIYRDLLTGI